MCISTKVMSIAAALALCLGAGAAVAETAIVWRSATTGTIAANTAPTTPDGSGGSETYDPLKITMSGKTTYKPGDSVEIKTIVTGGSGDISFGLVVNEATGVPPGLLLDYNTGVITGIAYRPEGEYPIWVDVYDRKTHKYTTGPMVVYRVAE